MSSRDVAEVAKRPYWREADARVIVEAWRRSGDALTEFAERHAIDRRRLARWAARLEVERPAIRFHAVRLATTNPESTEIEIALSDGWRVRVGRGFDSEDLRRVLELLAERSAC